MSAPAVDPFGEPVPAVDLSTAPIRVSKWFRTAGVSLFWGLVCVIVLARAVFFEPSDLSFERAVAWVHALLVSL